MDHIKPFFFEETIQKVEQKQKTALSKEGQRDVSHLHRKHLRKHPAARDHGDAFGHVEF